jgi:hypothetical protein
MNAAEEAREVERRHWLAPVAIGVCALAVMFTVAATQGLPIRDPDARFVQSPLVLIVLILAGFLLIDVIPRAIRSAFGGSEGFGRASKRIFGERWWNRRGLIVCACILGFYATYLSYRNLKSFVPFVAGGNHDAGLLDFDRSLFFGHDPSALLHSLLGTGISAEVLATAYVAFLSFVPISLGVALVWSSRVKVGVWYVTALTINWMLGIISYFLIPSLGPIYTRPDLFSDLPYTKVTELQGTLMEHRTEVLADPHASDAVGSIAAFASLHVAVIATAALIAHFARAPRLLRIGLWTYLALTSLATIYFGWHYVSDDIAGLAIAGVSTYTAAALTGFRRHPVDVVAQLSERRAGVT